MSQQTNSAPHPTDPALPETPRRAPGRPRPGRPLSSVSPAPAPRPAGERLAALDGLRFAAALSVVLFHFVGQIPDTFVWIWGRPYQQVFPAAHGFFAFGRLGVELFFLISGFVIAMSGWGRSPREFFVSRVSRLYPMYWIAVLLTAACLTLVDNPFGHPQARTVIANLTMLQTPMGVPNLDPVYWTLWPELCFYLMFAVVVWRGVTYQRIVLFCGLWTLAAVLAPATHSDFVTMVVNPVYAPYFIAGMAFHLMYRFRPAPLLWGIVAMSWLVAATYLLAPQDGRVDWATWSPWSGWLLLTETLFFALIAAVALGWTRRVRWRWLSTAGTLTFPLYLVHDCVGVSLTHALSGRIHPWLLVGLVTCSMIAAAYVLQRYAERPLAVAVRRSLRSATWQGPR